MRCGTCRKDGWYLKVALRFHLAPLRRFFFVSRMNFLFPLSERQKMKPLIAVKLTDSAHSMAGQRVLKKRILIYLLSFNKKISKDPDKERNARQKKRRRQNRLFLYWFSPSTRRTAAELFPCSPGRADPVFLIATSTAERRSSSRFVKTSSLGFRLSKQPTQRPNKIRPDPPFRFEPAARHVQALSPNFDQKQNRSGETADFFSAAHTHTHTLANLSSIYLG